MQVDLESLTIFWNITTIVFPPDYYNVIEESLTTDETGSHFYIIFV